MLCDYGCGKQGIYKFKNGKCCCSSHFTKCENYKNTLKERLTGSNNPFYGKTHTQKSKKLMSKSHKGTPAWNKGKNNIYSQETRKKMSESHKGKTAWNKSLKNWMPENSKQNRIKKIKGLPSSKKGKTYEELYGKEKAKQLKIDKQLFLYGRFTGSNSCHWKGGISGEPYCEQWKDKDYKESIKERDKYRCLNPECCSKNKQDIVIHHIDYNKLNCHPNNLITVCRSCNLKANFNRKWHKGWYKAIIFNRYKI